MQSEKIIFKFQDQNKEYSFLNGASLIEDKLLIKEFSKTNFRNQNSSLILKSMNNLPIYDVIQLKININEVGYVLVNFEKDKFLDAEREKLINSIKELKNTDDVSKEFKIAQLKKLIEILNEFKPIFASFKNNGLVIIGFDEVAKLEFAFPFLMLYKPAPKHLIRIGTNKKEGAKEKIGKNGKITKKNGEIHQNYTPFPLLDIDYFFSFMFAFLGTVSTTISVFEIINHDGIAAFLIILAFVFAITLIISVQSILYKNYIIKNPYQRLYLSIFIVAGIGIGLLVSYFICKKMLSTEIENFNYKNMTLISLGISFVAFVSSLSTSRLANLLLKRFKKPKKQD